MSSSHKVKEWNVNVKFQGNGALLATATGVLLAPPKVAVALVTDAAGDPLFRVVERKELPPWASGGRRVEVVNKAAIRVLAWKLWSTSTVVYEIGSSYQEPEGLGGQTAGMQLEQQEESVSFELKSGNMLQSLSGKWSLQPIRLHSSALPHDLRNTLPASAAGFHSSSNASLLQCLPPSSTSLRSGNQPRDSTLAPAGLFQEPGRGLKIRTRNTNSSSCSSGSSDIHARIGSPTKAKLLEKLAMLSPHKRHTATAAAAGEMQSSRPVVEITARTSSGPFTGSSSGDNTNSIENISRLDNSNSKGGLKDIPLEGLSNSSSSSGGKGVSPIKTAGAPQNPKAPLPAGLVVDAEGYVLATYVHYEQLAQPRGMPPGIRYVPGLSDAVAGSIGREVRQMLDKVSCVTDVVVSQGLTPQGALTAVVQAMEAAGGSFKALQKALRKQHQQHTKQQQQRDAASESPTSPFAWLRASPGPSPRSKMASQAALFSSPAGSAAAAVWGEGAGAGSDLSSGAGRKSSGAGRKTSAAGRKVSAASVVAAAAAAADAVNVGDGVQRLLGEDSVGVGTSLNPVLVPFGAGAAWGLEGCGSGAASGRELLSHPVVMGECSWADCDE